MHTMNQDQVVALWLRVDDLLSRIDVTKFGLSVDLQLAPCDEDQIVLVCSMCVRDVRTGNHLTLSLSKNLLVTDKDDDSVIVREIFDHTLEFVRHELSECFMFDQIRFLKDTYHP